MADSKLLYSTQQSITFTSLNSLAGSSTYLGGGNSAIVDNTSDAYIEVLINGHLSIQTGTITAGRSLELWAYSQIEDSGTLPRYDNTNALSTSSAAVTFASDYLKFAFEVT